ncbi:MAG: Planctomycete cytochrome [Verrucomicrobiaceae bacterium]|nr:Planctomycete cytochrome [Verrucomicrobiaceae bacterium]
MNTRRSILILITCLTGPSVRAAEDGPVDFVKQIKPIISERCIECHNSENLLGNVNLQNREHAMQKRKQEPVIVPNEPDKSEFYLTLKLPPIERKAMPATAHRLPKDDIEMIRQWIVEGAIWPMGKDGEITPRKYRQND